MEMTEVMKLNTSKDNVEAFFQKVKTKIQDVHSKPENNQNLDITMIVKHQNRTSLKHSHKPKETSTFQSILSENQPVAKAPNCKPPKPTIFNEDNQIQSRMLGTELQINRSTSQQNALKQNNESYASGKKLRQSNKMPSIGMMFRFQKKPEERESQSQQNKQVSPSCEITQEPELNVKFIEQPKKLCKPQKPQRDSESSHEQDRKEEENFKRKILHKNIDIFQNIEITSAVSEKLYSMRNVGSSKPNEHKRRRSITDESLLSPKSSKLAEDIKKESGRKIIESVKGKLIHKSVKKILQEADCIDQAKNTEDQKDEESEVKQLKEVKEIEAKGPTEENKNVRDSYDTDQFELQSIVTPKPASTGREREKVLVKRSIFDPQSQNHRLSSNRTSEAASSCQRVKTSSRIQIETQPQDDSSSESEQTSSQKSSSSNEEPEDSVYVIESKLNDCIRLLEKNELTTLEDYLYEFKDKYFYVSNTRIQIKWRLLMAHCKENKKEFERAAINYNHVIDLAKENPKSLTIEPSEVYHRLGVCYAEIGWWNKGILAFAQALNRFKKCKNTLKYAECMNNLGTLYMQASSMSLAEKCFIQAYNIKKSLYGKSNTKLLTSLFNIFECNLLTKNYEQSQKVITVIEEEIISCIPDTEPNKQLYFGGLYRRKGKMQFLRGNNAEAEKYYLKSFERLANKYPYCMEFGELMSALGLLKLEEMKYKEAKQYCDKAIMLMNFYCSKNSVTIMTLKRNLEFSVKMIQQEREGFSSKRSANFD